MNHHDTLPSGPRPGADPSENVRSLQTALDKTGVIRVMTPGIYDFNDTVLIGSNTALECGPGVFFRRKGSFGHLLLNRGAANRQYDRAISLTGVKLICNGEEIDRAAMLPGLDAHLAFFYVKDLVVRDLECLDLGRRNFCIQICTFENILLENLHIEGMKDAVHLGQGRRFTIRHGIFRTFDDPIALNAYDYSTSNPQFGWIEDGLVEDCHDLNQPDTTGFFCRMLAGAWGVWTRGMKVRNSDLVTYNGRVYSVNAQPDFREYVSLTPPAHKEGTRIINGIPWRYVQEDDGRRSASIHNVHFRDIFLRKRREVAFCMLLEFNQHARSVYPGAPAPLIEKITLENISSGEEVECLLESNAPCDAVRIMNSELPAVAVKLSIPKEGNFNFWSTGLLISGCRPHIDGGTLLECSANREAVLNVCSSLPAPKKAEVGISAHVDIRECDLPCKRTPSTRQERV